jgi:hypothetical protein
LPDFESAAFFGEEMLASGIAFKELDEHDFHALACRPQSLPQRGGGFALAVARIYLDESFEFTICHFYLRQ